MRVLVTGAKGMLGQEVVREFSQGHEVRGVDLEDFDLTDCAATTSNIEAYAPDLVVHCAAYTNVDGAESEPELAFKVNGLGTWAVAEACRRCGAIMLYISTDYVFAGDKPEGYRENDTPAPLSVYGASKHYGEVCMQRLLQRYYLVRTQWLYGAGGPNLVDTIVKLALAGKPLRFVNDQHACLTNARDLARQLRVIVEKKLLFGVYHANNAGECTPYELARYLLELLGLSPERCTVTTTAELGRPAPRPEYSLLLRSALQMQAADVMPEWRESLAGYLASRGWLKR